MSILTLGIDIGSTACKCVVMEDGTNLRSKAVVPLGTGTKGSAQVYEQALEEAGLTEQDLALRAATGYGRFNFARADVQRSELNCHAADAVIQDCNSIHRQGKIMVNIDAIQ